VNAAAIRESNRSETKQNRVLIVEDDAPIAASLVRGLKALGYAVELMSDGDRAAEVDCNTFDIAVIDVQLPGRSGLTLVEHFRNRSSAPLIVLTASTDLQTRLQAFRFGAADFLSKPFFLEELVARIEARLGLSVLKPSRQIDFDNVTVDLDLRTVTQAGRIISLTAHEFNVLAYLIERSGRPVSRAQLAMSALSESSADARTVDSHVARIRRKLGTAGKALVTIWAIGYAFRP
jgi:two-component system, OmpR family, response regulator